MKKSRKFVKNDGAKEIIIKSTTKTLSFHTKLDIGSSLKTTGQRQGKVV